MNNDIELKKAETRLLQSSAKNIINNLNSYFKWEKSQKITLKEKNRHTL